VKAINLRKMAKGENCYVRLPGCLWGGETVVLAHYRLAGTCGTGMKPPDILGAPTCSHCHDLIDGRTTPPEELSKTDLQLAHAEGILRWLYTLSAYKYRLKP